MTILDTNLMTIFNTSSSKSENVYETIDTSGQPTPFDEPINNIRSLIRRAINAMDSAQSVAEGNETPESYDAFSKITKNMTELNRELSSAIAARELYIKNQNKPDKAENAVTNNILAVGTTADLQKLLMSMQKENSHVTKD